MGFWGNVWRTKSKNFIAQYLDEAASAPIRNGYLTVDLDAFSISDVRIGLTKFYGVVHSNIAVPSIDGTTPEYQIISAPPELSKLDATHLDRIVTGPVRLLNGVPYRAGGVEIEVGLFSIAAADLAEPYLKLLGSLSAKAGISFISQAQPFVDILHAGFLAIAGGDSLEIGRAALFDPPRQGRYLIARATRSEFPNANFAVGPDGRELLIDGQAAQCPYMILNFHSASVRDDWFRIPELAEAYSKLRGSVRNQDGQLAEKLAMFRIVALTSPDLLPEHARSLCDQVEEEYRAFLAQPRVSTTDVAPVTRDAEISGPGPRRLAEFNPFAAT